MATALPLHTDLETIRKFIFDKCSLTLSDVIQEPEGTAYGACSFEINGKVVVYRVSKITPKKTGQFVTIWKRNQFGETAPYDVLDDLDFMVIVSQNDDQVGLFIFPKSLLAEKGIVSQNGKKGKRGIRVYPPWDKAKSAQAEKTQSWQLKYFLRSEIYFLVDNL